jgi:hypothetical protein
MNAWLSLLIAMNPLFPLEKAIWFGADSPPSNQLVTNVPFTTFRNLTMLYICLHRCSQIHPLPQVKSGFIVTGDVLKSESCGGPTL